MYNDSLDEDEIVALFGVIAAIGVVILIVILASIRTEQYVTIDNKYYVFERAIKWDESWTSIDYECEGNGNNQKCEWVTNHHTTTHTRCSNRVIGYELPIVPPELSCIMHSDDYISDWVYYNISYHSEDGKYETKSISGESWHDYELKSTMKLTLNGFGTIVKADKKGK